MIRLWNALPQATRVVNQYTDFLEDTHKKISFMNMHKKYFIHEYKNINKFNYDTEIQIFIWG